MLNVIGFDLETYGDLQEYALQPFRAAYGLAGIRAASFSRDDKASGLLNPDPETLRGVLTKIIEQRLTIVGWNVCFDAAWLIAVGLEKEVFQLKWLDAMLLWRHAVVEPEGEDVPQNKRKSYALEAAMHEFFPESAGFKDFKDFQATDAASLQRLLHRNKEDARFTVKLAEMFWAMLTPKQQRVALIEAHSIPQVARTYVQGLKINKAAAEKLQGDLILAGEEAYAKLLHDYPDVGGVDLGSPKKLANLLFTTWALPVGKLSKKTSEPSTDKYVLADLAVSHPHVALVKVIRESKNCGTKYAKGSLDSLAYNGDGYVRPWARIFGTYCVTGDVEVLTRNGWVRLDIWVGGDIAQVYPGTQEIEFLPASRFTGPVVKQWVSVDHSRLRCLFTEGHTIPYLSQKSGAWMTLKAGELINKNIRHPLAGYLKMDGSLTVEQMRVLAMFQADGSVRRGVRSFTYKFTFVRSRKVLRFRQVMESAGVEYREYVCDKYPDRTEFHINHKAIPTWWRPEYKQLGSWLLNTTQEGLKAFVQEAEHWDGSTHKDGGFRYTSHVEDNVDWMVTAAHLTGYKANKFADNRSCHISYETAEAMLRHDRHITTVEKEETAYCATTVTGFWLARSNGKVFITGNTSRMTYASKQKQTIVEEKRKKNKETKKIETILVEKKIELPTGIALHQWKRGKAFRNLIEPPPGYGLLELDVAGQEFRWMAVASKDETMLSLCEPGEDAHSYMGAQVAEVDYRDLIRRVHEDDPEAGNQRKCGKFCNLSYQYRVSAKTATVKARIDYGLDVDQEFIQRTQDIYRSSYIGVGGPPGRVTGGYWRDQIYKCKQLGYAETFAGRRVQLNGNWSSRNEAWALESTAINYPIQGTGGDQKYLAMAVAKNQLPKFNGYFYYELHDGLFYIFPWGKIEQAGRYFRKLLSNLPYKEAWDLNLPIKFPVDGKIGPSWGGLKEFE